MTSRLKILIYADVDMNLTDGSSIWLNSLVQVLAMEPANQVTVLLKARITKELLLEDLKRLPNVHLIDPYQKFTSFAFSNKNRMTLEDAVGTLVMADQEINPGCLIIRGLEICRRAMAVLPEPARVIPYITGFSAEPGQITAEERLSLRSLFDAVKLMFLQTEEMKRAFLQITGGDEKKIAILPPMVPDFPAEKPEFANQHQTLVYVGKFSNDYYLYESLQAFSGLGEEGYRFHIAGDKFHLDLKIPKEDLIAMMGKIPGVTWHQALNREEVSELISKADIGLCWRSEAIDNERSMELSTKLLEYGRLAKPVLVRRIPIHERLLGSDYPFYVDTGEDFKACLKRAFTDPSAYEKAARRTYEVSLGHSFSVVCKDIMPYLDRFAKAQQDPSGPMPGIQREPGWFEKLKNRWTR